jgi:hypothetical protein
MSITVTGQLTRNAEARVTMLDTANVFFTFSDDDAACVFETRYRVGAGPDAILASQNIASQFKRGANVHVVAGAIHHRTDHGAPTFVCRRVLLVAIDGTPIK